jgi:putative toxin-antitoxin system antitoxin component (TIGR02293 family)
MAAAGKAIARVLGGEPVLGVKRATEAQWGQMILRGMPVRCADALRQAVALPETALARLLGVSEEALTQARGGTGRLGPQASYRLYSVARIVALAILVLESEQGAKYWLTSPQRPLGGQQPIALLSSEAGKDLVEKLLVKIGREARVWGSSGSRDVPGLLYGLTPRRRPDPRPTPNRAPWTRPSSGGPGTAA